VNAFLSSFDQTLYNFIYLLAVWPAVGFVAYLRRLPQFRQRDSISFTTVPQERLSSATEANNVVTRALEQPPTLHAEPRKAASYYRPELDALRFFAFPSVFIAHSPTLNYGSSSQLWKQEIGRALDRAAHAGVYGLPLFFFLSSFLITELLLREHEKTGSIHVKAFYARRILRIWPLYYLGVLCAIAVSAIPSGYPLTHREIVYLVFFLGYLGGAYHGNPLGILWSISVEELFYVAWPWIARAGKQVIKCVAFLCFPVSLATLWIVLPDAWYNPICHFLFFATGALVALKFHQRAWSLSLLGRILMFAAGVIAWLMPIFYWDASRWVNRTSFLIADIGVVLIFLSVFQFNANRIPRWTIYLGQISYGLYVFHLVSLRFVERVIIRHLSFAGSQFCTLLTTMALSLVLTIAIASVSYRYFEMPFLRLKERFQFIRSRSVSA